MKSTVVTSSLACLLAGALLAAIPAEAGIMYSVREGDDTLVSIDTDTLQITPIGPLGMQFKFGGLAWNSQTSTLFAVDGRDGRNALWTIDTDTGHASLVGIHGLPEMFGLTYDASTDTLYAGQSTQAQGFYELDQNNGTATPIGNPQINLDGLAYDPDEDMIVGACAGPGDLYDIDRATAVPTLLYNGDFFNNGGLTWDPEKKLLWFIDWSGNLYTFDPSNGYQRETKATGLGAHDGLAFVTGGGCGEKAKLKAKCLKNGTKVKGKLKKANPNVQVTFRLDGGQAQAGQTNNKGKAKAKWKGQNPGGHTVTVCDLEERC